jgi:hypothetical protein
VAEDLSISGSECVEALCLAGFRVRRHAEGATVLTRDGRTVVVPDSLTLVGDVLDRILDDADLPPERFLWLISEAPTTPEIVPID